MAHTRLQSARRVRLATGILLDLLAATAFRTRQPVAVAGAFIGGASSIGLMSVVNFVDWVGLQVGPAACALLWALSLLAYRRRKLPLGDRAPKRYPTRKKILTSGQVAD